MSSQAGTPSVQRTFLGHPVGLFVLFFTEMWERFSYYGMRALLVLYMINYYKWSQQDASSVYKWYTSLVYLTPLLGGFLADRFLGNKRAVVIGAILMAIGQFLLAFEPFWLFYSALVFLIVGNGFFKPNMSTQVGRLYPQNDPRRDGAYTIFYMGINLGAFLAPLVCGGLAYNTAMGYHAGFIAAGVGMLLGLGIYLVGLPWVIELPPDTAPAAPREPEPEAPDTRIAPPAPAPTPAATAPEMTDDERPLTEAEAERTPSSFPILTSILPIALVVAGALLAIVSPILAWLKVAIPGIGVVDWDTTIALEITAACAFFAAWITAQVHHAARDRVLAIFILGVFVVFFWGAFEQAGNALNQWADKTTDRYLLANNPVPSPYPDEQPAVNSWLPSGLGWFSNIVNPVSAPAFQSINALGIFVLAPFFAVLWTWLDRRMLNPSVPMKMAFGLVFMAAAFALMIWAAERENGPTNVSYAAKELPRGIETNEQGQIMYKEGDEWKVAHAGRLTFDKESHTLHMTGVLPDIERDRIVRATAPADYAEALKILKEDTEKNNGNGEVGLLSVPEGFDLRYAGKLYTEGKITFDPDTKLLKAHDITLAEKDIKTLLVCGGDKEFRAALDKLYVESARYQVSSWWLFWFYILATIGELCLSPIGLSMVSKLAPARFATMLMGLWLLTSFFGNFAAGAFGEKWGEWAPIGYFTYIMALLAGAAVVLFVLVPSVVKMMHRVK